MTEERKTPGPGATGAEGCKRKHKQLESSTQGLESQDEDELREALLAELRCELVLSKMDTLNIERLGIALKHRLIGVQQCLAIQANPASFADREGGA